jgi:HPt (histidine-containing phosphotransfer) domain-containing protein
MMPGMDGVETVAEIRKLGGKYEKLIIIALTANAITGAREMFIENGFNDFISKPINENALQAIVHRYLPPGKIKEGGEFDDKQAASERESEFRRKAIITFYKDNEHTYESMVAALKSGDTTTAHRIAHTLKSSAAYLGKKALENASASLETSLHGKPPVYTPEQLDNMKRELKRALAEYRPIVAAAESAKPSAVKIGKEELAKLLGELKTLLEKNDFGASAYVEKLEGIEGMDELASAIDDYDFTGALSIIENHC